MILMRYLVVSLALCLSAQAATFYVRKDGNDANAGNADSAGGAWRTIGKAASRVNPGDTVYVRRGTYQEYVTLTRPGTAASRITWYGERTAQGDWLTIVDASQEVNTGWVRATEVDPAGNGVYKHTSLPFRPGALIAGNKFVPEFLAGSQDPVGTSAGLTFSPGGQTPLNASSSAIRVDSSFSGPYWNGLEACWHWKTNTSTAYVRFRNGANPNSANVRIVDNGGESEAAVNKAPLLIRASWNTWNGFHVRNAGTVIAVNPDPFAAVEGVVVISNNVTGSAYPIQLNRSNRGSSISSCAVLRNVVTSGLFAGETGGAWSIGSAPTWTQYHTYLWNKNQGTRGGSDYGAIGLFECATSNVVSGNIIHGIDQGIRVVNYYELGRHTTISSNYIKGVSGTGVYFAFGNAYDQTYIHDNLIENAHIHFRHHGIRRNTPANHSTSRVYLYRNRGWNVVSGGSWLYVHHDTGTFLGGQLWAYHNSMAQGGSGINVSSLLPGGYREGRILNNIFNVVNTVSHESAANMKLSTSFAVFDYNLIREISNNPPWYDSENILNTAYVWGNGSTPPSSMPSFQISSSSLAWNAGTNLAALGLPDSRSGPGSGKWDIGAHELNGPTAPEEPIADEYRLTVNSGSGSGDYSSGSVVSIVAAAAPQGQVFDRWTGDTAFVANINSASTSITMPEANASVTASYQAASGGVLSLSVQATDDAFLQGTTRFNDSTLKVEAGKRVAYLKFTVPALSGSVQRATLRLQENGDVGSGTLRVYRGSHNNWTETTLTTANAPAENGQLGTFTGSIASAQTVSVDVTPLVTGSGTYSILVKQDTGGNDVWFGSAESTRKPQLVIETSGGSAPAGYSLSVNGGTGSGTYAAGTTVTITAAAPPSGQVFDRWTGSTATVANVNATSTSLTMPAANVAVTASYRSVNGSSSTTFQPTDDAYLQGTTRLNDSTLKVQDGYRVAYLKFAVSGLSGNIQSATLRLQENGDIGSGTLRVYRGSHNNWTETTLTTANAPAVNGQVGTFTGTVSSAQVVNINVTPLITGNGTYSVIVKLDAGGNDIWLGSDESARRPQLIVATTSIGTQGPASLYTVNVNGGSGSGSYSAGSTVDIAADAAPEGQEFDQWIGDIENVADVNAASTSITMPEGDITLTAVYREIVPVSAYELTVSSGSGSGTYTVGSTVDITADAAPVGQEFDQWTGDVAGVVDVNAESTSITMPNGDTTVTAAYRVLSAPLGYSLTVNLGDGSGNYPAGLAVNIAAEEAPPGQEFDQWTGDTANVENVSAASTLFTMPAADVTVTASYREVPPPQAYSLTVNNGSGSGSHTAGSTVNIAAAAAPAGQEFDQWTGDTANVEDINEASTWITMPAADVSIAPGYRVVNFTSTSFPATHDAYLQGTIRLNDATLRVEAGNRVSYLKFEVSGLTGDIQSATLRLQENGDTGGGTLRVHRGSHSGWTETTLTTANAPGESGEVGTFTGAVTTDQVVSIDVTPLITGNGTYSVIVKMDAGGNDIWFGSEESAHKPELVIETSVSAPISYSLTVNNGSGSGSYTAGSTVNIAAAAPPAGQEFDRWTGDTGSLVDASLASTSITMPPANVNVTAAYRTIPTLTYSLTVNNGSGSGNYTAGSTVNIAADGAPAGQEFDQWTGDTAEVADVSAASTSITMPAANISLTAAYRTIPPLTYSLTVNHGSGSGNYTAGSTVNIAANAAPAGQEFDQWTGDTASVANASLSSTSITMPAADVTVTAGYRTVSIGSTSFQATDDAYLQGTTRLNDATLRVQADNRVSYLKFEVSGLSGDIQSATLRLQENGDTGSGTLRVLRGSHNSWTETTLTTANAPGESGEVGTFTGAVTTDQVVSIDVTPLITGNGTYSVIVKMEAGGNDIWFGSEESAHEPELVIETSASTPISYSLTVNNGSGSGSYTAGSTVNIAAAAPPAGQEFDQWTGDTASVANASLSSTSITMPAADVTVTAGYRTVSIGSTSFPATHDAYLQGTIRLNDATLRVEAGNRVSYLKFEVSGLTGNIQSATLRLQENGDTGSGTLRVHRGSHNSWTETTLTTANAPGESGEVGAFTGAVTADQVVSIDVTPLITGNGTYSVIVKMDAGGNDIWFGSEESAHKPELVIETSGGGIIDEPQSFAEEPIAPEDDFLARPEPPFIWFSQIGTNELELRWEVSGEALYEVQMRTSLNAGEWTTLPSSPSSGGTRRATVVIGPTSAFFRVIRSVGKSPFGEEL